MKRFNIFENVHFSEDKEIEEIIFENQNIKALRIVSLNQKTDFMKEENLELVLVARGKAKLFCLLYTSPSPRDRTRSRMPSSA